MKSQSSAQNQQSLSIYLEMWILSALFVVVLSGLLQLQNKQLNEQSEATRQSLLQNKKDIGELTRNETPSLGY